MTRKEAIFFLKNANAQSELALKKLLEVKDKAERIGKVGEYYANFENCVKEIEACNIAISALQELEEAQPEIGDWIPCSERLPENPNSYLVTKHIDETEDNTEMSEVCTEIFWYR